MSDSNLSADAPLRAGALLSLTVEAAGVDAGGDGGGSADIGDDGGESVVGRHRVAFGFWRKGECGCLRVRVGFGGRG